MFKRTLYPYLFAFLAGVALTFCAVRPASAQQLVVATGGAGNTYSQMLQELTAVCGSTIGIVEKNTSGSMQNVSLLTGNKVNAAFVQHDVLAYRAQTEDLGKVKTLATLFPEEVHVLALTESKLKEGGVMGVGAKPVVFQSVQSLAGRRVGAAGGSFITAQVIRLQSEIAFEVREYPDSKAVLAAINTGEIEAGVFVGGQPLPFIDALKGTQYKLLPFPEAIVGKLKAVYKPTRLNYADIRQTGIQSVSTDALFVTREYKTEEMVSSLSALRACFRQQAPKLGETTGKHAKWSDVDIDNQGKWPYYQLPTVQVTAPATKRK